MSLPFRRIWRCLSDVAFEPILMIVIFAAVLAPLELLFPSSSRPAFSGARYRTDLLHAVVGGYLIRVGTSAVLVWLVALSGVWGSAWKLPLGFELIAVLLVSDLCFWLAHRLVHAVPALWEFHRIHHSSQHLDWLATYRVHPVDQIFNSTVIALPTLLLGFSPGVLFLYGLVYQLHAVLLHSNVRVTFGPLGKIFAEPRFHHWHHATDRAAYDKNFGGQLIIWDHLFGTAHHSSDYPEVGVDDPPDESFLAHMATPFAANWRQLRKTPR